MSREDMQPVSHPVIKIGVLYTIIAVAIVSFSFYAAWIFDAWSAFLAAVPQALVTAGVITAYVFALTYEDEQPDESVEHGHASTRPALEGH